MPLVSVVDHWLAESSNEEEVLRNALNAIPLLAEPVSIITSWF